MKRRIGVLLIFLLICGVSQAQWPTIKNRNDNTIMQRIDSSMNVFDYRDTTHSAQTIKTHVPNKVDAAEASAWRNFTGFTLITSESSGGFIELYNDSSFVCRQAGMYAFGGCVHVQNNTGGGFTTYVVLSRLYKNNTTEARCSQRGYGGELRAGGEDVLSYNGTDYLVVGDTIRLQYYTNNADTDFDSNSAFDSQVAATLWMHYIGE